MKTKTVVSLSGGMDSTTVLAMARAEHDEVHAVSFQYGSKHNEREFRAAQLICDHYEVFHKRIDLPFIGELFNSHLLKSGGEIPEGHYADPVMQKTVVPFRNGIMLAILAGYAESIGAVDVFLGAHAGDHAIYPDCRPEFVTHMKSAISAGTYAKIKLRTPFIGMTKTELLVLGHKIQVPYGLTYSCYKGGELHCGVCGTCYERKEAFRDAQIPDPTPYENHA